jgi:hypothetical protein
LVVFLALLSVWILPNHVWKVCYDLLLNATIKNCPDKCTYRS